MRRLFRTTQFVQIPSFQFSTGPPSGHSISGRKKSTMKGTAKVWMDRHVNDHYVKQARIQKYRSRSSFKLLEINTRFNLLKPGIKVVDVGAAPGGWSQIIAEQVGSQEGRETVVAADLLEIKPILGVKCIQGNISEPKTQEKISEALDYEKADLVCSDAVPDFMGERFVDHMRSTNLNRTIIEFCRVALKPGGSLLMKIIQGPAEKELSEFADLFFKKLQKVKPSASRNESAETYYLCQGFEQSEHPAAVKHRDRQARLDLARDDPRAQKEVYEEINEEQVKYLKELIEHGHSKGLDIPDKLKDYLKTTHLGDQLTLDNRMSAREKAKAKQKFQAEKDQEFFERTGIRDQSEDFTLENMMKKYEYDMAEFELEDRNKLRAQRKAAFRKLNDIDPETGKPRGGEDFDPDEDPGSSDLDNEFEQLSRNMDSQPSDGFLEYYNKRKKGIEKQKELYEGDEPYDAVYDERFNEEEQEKVFESKIEKLEKEQDKLKKTPEQAEEDLHLELEWEAHARILDQITNETNDKIDMDDLKYDEDALEGDMALLRNLEDADRKRKDSLYSKRAARQSVRRRGGLRQESPFFDDD